LQRGGSGRQLCWWLRRHHQRGISRVVLRPIVLIVRQKAFYVVVRHWPRSVRARVVASCRDWGASTGQPPERGDQVIKEIR